MQDIQDPVRLLGEAASLECLVGLTITISTRTFHAKLEFKREREREREREIKRGSKKRRESIGGKHQGEKRQLRMISRSGVGGDAPGGPRASG